MAIHFGRPAACLSGVMTSAEPGQPVDVSTLAGVAGIQARVTFAPDVWAACEPGEGRRSLLEVRAARDQHAIRILRSLARQRRGLTTRRFQMRCQGARGWLRLEVDFDIRDGEPLVLVSLAR